MTLQLPQAALPALNSIDHLNRLYNHVQFLVGPGCDAFEQMISEIRSLMRPTDKLAALPDVASAGAWKNAFEIWSWLKNREREEANSAAREEQRRELARSAEAARAWQDFLAHREIVIDWRQRGILSADAYEYLNLAPGDLDDPLGPENHEIGQRPRRKDWSNVNYRLMQAISKFRAMSDAEKQLIPQTVEARRIHARIRDIEQQIINRKEVSHEFQK